MIKPQRGEIWWVNFDPTVGAEINKNRVAVIVSVDSVGRLPLRIVVPITEWDERYSSYPWMVKLMPDKANGLAKASTADSFQVKSLSIDRFSNRIGTVTPSELAEITAAIQMCIGVV